MSGKRGVTLLEMLIVVAIIAAIVSVSFPAVPVIICPGAPLSTTMSVAASAGCPCRVAISTAVPGPLPSAS